MSPSSRPLQRLELRVTHAVCLGVFVSLAPASIPITAAATAAPAAALADSSGTWSAAPPLLFARAAHAVVSTETAIYALAGTREDGRNVPEVERFDGSAWTVETTLPGTGLNAPAAVVLNDRIYLIGGFSGTTNTPTNQVLVYDLTTHAWSQAAPLPAPRGGHAAAVLDGRIHVVGGGNNVSTLADHSVYDPASNTWTDLAPLPFSKGSPAALVFSGALYVIGGRSGVSDFGDVSRYDPASNSWQQGPAIEPRGTAGAVEYCGTIYVIGGESQAGNAALGTVLRLNPATQVWEFAPTMPTARVYARAVPFGGSIYVVGGGLAPVRSHATPGTNVVERYHSDCTE